jgi:hypothetical protein
VAADPNRGVWGDSLIVEIDASELTLGRFDQLTHDISALIREVAGEVTGEGRDAVRWVIEDIRRESPLRIDLSPRPAKDEVSPDLVRRVASAITQGIAVIEERPERPEHFNDTALERAKDLATRVGEDVHSVRFRSKNGVAAEPVAVTKRLAANVQEIVGPQLERFGTVEGRLEGLVVHQRRVLYIWETLTNRRVECFFGERIPLDEVLAAFGRRVAARGLIRTRKTGEKLSIEANELHVFPPEEDLRRWTMCKES